MNINISKDGKVSPLNLLFNGEKSSPIPCAKNPNSVHKLVLWSAHGITEEEVTAHVADMQLISNAAHTLTYEFTGVAHNVELASAPLITSKHVDWIEFTVEFREI